MTEAQLFEAYRNTLFCADTPVGQLRIRVGQQHAELDSLLDQFGALSWAYITAWNPASIKTMQSENESRQAALLRDLESYAVFHGEGIGADGDWDPEPSFLALGISESDAFQLGCTCGQHAIVVGHRGEAAGLRSCIADR